MPGHRWWRPDTTARVGRSLGTSASSSPAGSSEPVDLILAPFRAFTSSNVAGGVVLLAATLLALVWANSPWADSYFELWAAPLTVSLGDLTVSESLLHWINDGLMAIFFLVVGLEIKRELLVGELDSPRRAALPIAAAIGGAILPAIIFTLVVQGGPGSSGWGIPMATDIAFALGVLALLGPRVPLGLRIFVTALAIADDLLAVLVIAVFYSGELDPVMLGAAAGLVALLLLLNRLGVRRPMVYLVIGVVLWLVVLRSGVHATVAGVLLAATIPARVRLDAPAFVARSRSIIDRFDHTVVKDPAVGVEDDHEDLWELETVTEQAQAPTAAPRARAAAVGGVPHRAPVRACQRRRGHPGRAARRWWSTPCSSGCCSDSSSGSRSGSLSPHGSSCGLASRRCPTGSAGGTCTELPGSAASASR